MNKELYEIRNATISDVSDISELSGQLGYSTSELEIKERLSSMLNSKDHVVYVAFVSTGKVIGWIHVYESKRVQSGSFAEIGGFVVSENFRRKGIGKILVKAAEQWTVQNKFTKLRVRSNINREDTNEFYSNMGFSMSKQQRVFNKTIA